MTKLKKLTTAGALSTTALCIAFAGSAFAATQGTTGSTDMGRHQLTAEQRVQREAEMDTKFNTAFSDAETAGKITAAQKAKLLELHEAVKTQMQSGNREAAETARDAMHTWMTSENIDASVMPTPPANGNGHGQGPKGSHVPSTTTSSNSTTSS